MNRLKKATFGVLVAGLAFGFSAFTTVKKRSIVRYYKTDLAYPSASNPNGYTYFSGDMCAPVGNICSAEWDIGTWPFPSEYDALPISGITFQTGSVATGHFEL